MNQFWLLCHALSRFLTAFKVGPLDEPGDLGQAGFLGAKIGRSWSKELCKAIEKLLVQARDGTSIQWHRLICVTVLVLFWFEHLFSETAEIEVLPGSTRWSWISSVACGEMWSTVLKRVAWQGEIS